MSELAKVQQNILNIRKRIRKMELDKDKVKLVLQNNNLTFDTPAEKNQFFEEIKKDEDTTKKKLQALGKEEETLTKVAKNLKAQAQAQKEAEDKKRKQQEKNAIMTYIKPFLAKYKQEYDSFEGIAFDKYEADSTKKYGEAFTALITIANAKNKDNILDTIIKKAKEEHAAAMSNYTKWIDWLTDAKNTDMSIQIQALKDIKHELFDNIDNNMNVKDAKRMIQEFDSKLKNLQTKEETQLIADIEKLTEEFTTARKEYLTLDLEKYLQLHKKKPKTEIGALKKYIHVLRKIQSKLPVNLPANLVTNIAKDFTDLKDYIKSVTDKALSNALRVVLEITQQEQVYSKQNDPEYEQEETHKQRNNLVHLLESFLGQYSDKLREGLITEVKAKLSKILQENDNIEKKIQKQLDDVLADTVQWSKKYDNNGDMGEYIKKQDTNLKNWSELDIRFKDFLQQFNIHATGRESFTAAGKKFELVQYAQKFLQVIDTMSIDSLNNELQNKVLLAALNKQDRNMYITSIKNEILFKKQQDAPVKTQLFEDALKEMDDLKKALKTQKTETATNLQALQQALKTQKTETATNLQALEQTLNKQKKDAAEALQQALKTQKTETDTNLQALQQALETQKTYAATKLQTLKTQKTETDTKLKELETQQTETATKLKELQTQKTETDTKLKELETQQTETATKLQQALQKVTKTDIKLKEALQKVTETDTKLKEALQKVTETDTKLKEALQKQTTEVQKIINSGQEALDQANIKLDTLIKAFEQKSTSSRNKLGKNKPETPAKPEIVMLVESPEGKSKQQTKKEQGETKTNATTNATKKKFYYYIKIKAKKSSKKTWYKIQSDENQSKKTGRKSGIKKGTKNRLEAQGKGEAVLYPITEEQYNDKDDILSNDQMIKMKKALKAPKAPTVGTIDNYRPNRYTMRF